MSNVALKKYSCPCCTFKTMKFDYTNTFSICPICYWVDDGTQFFHPDYAEGANKVSLNKAKFNYLKYGAVLKEHIGKTRKPKKSEL